jgi:hypothetical protein
MFLKVKEAIGKEWLVLFRFDDVEIESACTTLMQELVKDNECFSEYKYIEGEHKHTFSIYKRRVDVQKGWVYNSVVVDKELLYEITTIDVNKDVTNMFKTIEKTLVGDDAEGSCVESDYEADSEVDSDFDKDDKRHHHYSSGYAPNIVSHGFLFSDALKQELVSKLALSNFGLKKKSVI